MNRERNACYHPTAGGHIGPKEMLNGAGAFCLLMLVIQLISSGIDGIRWMFG